MRCSMLLIRFPRWFATMMTIGLGIALPAVAEGAGSSRGLETSTAAPKAAQDELTAADLRIFGVHNAGSPSLLATLEPLGEAASPVMASEPVGSHESGADIVPLPAALGGAAVVFAGLLVGKARRRRYA